MRASLRKKRPSRAKTAPRRAPAEGSAGFHENWNFRREAVFNHWTRGRPKNQVQLAFRMHWRLFGELLGDGKGGKCLEVGCGRGTISSYFADAGYSCTLLDYSEKAVAIAREIFRAAGLKADFVVGDANKLPFRDGSFDVVVSIGLLEHFEDPGKALREQHRVLKRGGTCLAYVVPERPDNVQKNFLWLNGLLKAGASFLGERAKQPPKAGIYRSDAGSERYVEVLRGLDVKDLQVSGVYPLPLVSHSPEFPFSLLPAPFEWGLARIFEGVLAARRFLYGRNPWLCDERTGQAFLVSFRKA